MSYFAQLSDIRSRNEELASRVANLARERGADEASVSVFAGKGVEVSSRHCDVDMIEFNRDQSLTLTVYIEGRNAQVATSDLSEESLLSSVDAAISLCAHTSKDEFAGLPEAEDLFRDKDAPDLEQVFECPEDTDFMADCAVSLEKKAMRVVKETEGLTDSDGSDVEAGYTIRTVANTLGFVNSKTVSFCARYISLVGEAAGVRQRAGSYTAGCDFASLMSDESIIEEARRKTVGRLNARQVPTGTYPVIFINRAAAGLFGHFEGVIAGSAVYRKRSFLADALSSEVFPDFVNIREDPHLKGRAESAYFDSTGVATAPMDLIRDGRLCNYLLGAYSARRLNMKNTGHNGANYCCSVDFGAERTVSFEELLRRAGRGIVVESLIGQGVDEVTGNYSRGASGYYFEDGERKFAVDEITVAGNLKEMFMNMSLTADDYDSRQRIRTGSVLIDGMAVSGC